MSESMVEKVARAMHQELAGSDPDETIHHPAQKSWEEPSQRRWEQWVDAARAAIEALDLAEMLKPFAQAHEDRPDINDHHPRYDDGDIWESASAMSITFGDLRRAADLCAALSNTEAREEHE